MTHICNKVKPICEGCGHGEKHNPTEPGYHDLDGELCTKWGDCAGQMDENTGVDLIRVRCVRVKEGEAK